MASIQQETQERMQKSIDVLKENLASIRTGRANPHVLDDIMVDYFGTQTPIVQLAAVKVVEGTTLVIEPWDKSVLEGIEKAIQLSDLGITPNSDGACLRLPFPAPTEQRRLELAREAKQYGEEAKVAIRNVRRDMNGKISRDEELSKDEQRGEENKVQKATDDFVSQVDSLISHKEKEIMEI